MTDRVPGAPGQYKATITNAELQKLQNGEEFNITLIRDDQPTVKGTPYNKASVLPDELAAVICPEVDDPTPADAFAHLLPAIESTDYSGCYYRTVDGVTEWVNPPMVAGVEYLTTERYFNKPVYTMVFYLGALPNASALNISLPSNVLGFTNCISAFVITQDGLFLNIVDSVNSNSIWVKTSGDYSNKIAYVIIKYTKN